MTVGEFQRFLFEAAGQLARTWRQYGVDDPDFFPQELSLEEWWEIFCQNTVPEILIEGAAGVAPSMDGEAVKARS
jgi:hypothetical protein